MQLRRSEIPAPFNRPDEAAAPHRSLGCESPAFGGMLPSSGTGDRLRPTVNGLAAACERMPRAVVCLQSAAYLQGLLDEAPARMWFAVPQGSSLVRMVEPSWYMVRWSNVHAFRIGVAADDSFGLPVRRTDSARTVVDLVRYARYLRGPQPGITAARRYVAGGGRASDLVDMAELLRVPAGTMRSLQILAVALHDGVP